jgi:hypothetical protein
VKRVQESCARQEQIAPDDSRHCLPRWRGPGDPGLPALRGGSLS